MLQERDLLLITGVPGTGKTTYGGMFATEFGFVHHDLEDQQTLNRFVANRAQFIGELLNEKKNVVATWGFAPDDEPSVSLVLQLRSAGFEWIWFDGNRPAALREFLKRGTVQEIALYVQMYRIEKSGIVEQLNQQLLIRSMTVGNSNRQKSCLRRSGQCQHANNYSD